MYIRTYVPSYIHSFMNIDEAFVASPVWFSLCFCVAAADCTANWPIKTNQQIDLMITPDDMNKNGLISDELNCKTLVLILENSIGNGWYYKCETLEICGNPATTPKARSHVLRSRVCRMQRLSFLFLGMNLKLRHDEFHVALKRTLSLDHYIISWIIAWIFYS